MSAQSYLPLANTFCVTIRSNSYSSVDRLLSQAPNLFRAALPEVVASYSTDTL